MRAQRLAVLVFSLCLPFVTWVTDAIHVLEVDECQGQIDVGDAVAERVVGLQHQADPPIRPARVPQG